MSARSFVFVCVLFLGAAASAAAQSASDITHVSLTIDEGFPLQVILTEKVRFKEKEAVRGRIVEAVYAFDREVIPAGTEVFGRITGFRSAGKLKKFFSMLGGDFTPQREPQIAFDIMILPNGKQMAIETFVAAGTKKHVRSDGVKETLKKGIVSTVKEPGKEKLKTFLWSIAPFRPQSLPVGTPLKATLLTPVDFGTVELRTEELAMIGSQPAPDSVLSARLVTALDSRNSKNGSRVEAIVTRPLFSPGERLIFPAGSRLIGEVVEARGARNWHRNGAMALRFTSIETPDWMLESHLPAREIKGRLAGVQLSGGMNNVRINPAGDMRISESKKRFLAPAYAFIKAGRAVNDTPEALDRALVSAYQSKVTKQFGRNEPGLGLAGSVSGAMVPQVGIGLGFYGAAKSIYSNFIGRGQDIQLPADTSIEIHVQ